MANCSTSFESYFGVPLPKLLKNLYFDSFFSKSIPAVFGFKSVGFVLGVRQLLDINDPKNYDVKNNFLKFAINADGFVLLLDLSSDNLDVLQDEFGDVDSIGLNINDLLSAEKI